MMKLILKPILGIFCAALLINCNPPIPPTATCSSLTVEQITLASTNYSITYKGKLNWGTHAYKIQLNGNDGMQSVFPEIIIYDGVSDSLPVVGSYTYTNNVFDIADTTNTDRIFYYVVTLVNPYDYKPDSTAVQTMEITNVTGNNVSGCLIGKVVGSNPSDVREIQIKFVDVPF
jgi:hypothetical protein